MNTKLTLMLDKKVIDQAKLYSKGAKTSLSKIVENYLTTLTENVKKPKNKQIQPTTITDSLAGVLSEDMIDERKTIGDYLADKYL